MTVNIKGLGKITASKEVLNYLSLIMGEGADNYHEKGRYQLSADAQSYSDAIYCALAKENYYK